MSAKRYPDEIGQRAVRMAFEICEQSGDRKGVIGRVARQLGIDTASLRGWVRQVRDRRRSAARRDHSRAAAHHRVRNARIASCVARTRSSKWRRLSSRASSTLSAQMTALIDAYRDRFGVTPICHTLEIAPSVYYAAKTRPPATRTLRDEWLAAHIKRIYDANYQVYGARKIWRALHREDIAVAGAPWSGGCATWHSRRGAWCELPGAIHHPGAVHPRADRPLDLAGRRRLHPHCVSPAA
jgi:putative transposase